jgi:predicted Fe-S protein YdhL (DUF1289 family)
MTDEEIFIASPCIDNCCLDDNDICLGCFRSLQEILQWNALGSQERLAVLRNASQRQNERSPGPDGKG